MNEGNEIFLNSKTFPMSFENSSLIQALFVSSIPEKGIKVIPNTCLITSICEHEICSSLPSLSPEIIFKFPKEDLKNSVLEVNNLMASLCFPYGIKVCYSQEENKKTFTNYSNIVTDQYGNRYYLYGIHFYKKVLAKKFRESAGRDEPIAVAIGHLSNKFKLKSEEVINDVMKKIALLKSNLANEYVYIPCCLCLISKYPHFSELERLTKFIYTIIIKDNFNKTDLTKFLILLLKGIPIPHSSVSVKLDMPHWNISLLLKNAFQEDLFLINNGMKNFILMYSRDFVLNIFRLILSEQKVIFVDDNYQKIFETIYSVLNLMYPFKWPHGLIPNLNLTTTKYLNAIFPYIIGIHRNIYPSVEEIILGISDPVFIVDLSKQEINLNSDHKSAKKM
ncbi:MAG: hypothetical protein MJ252_07895 [archaeon]|nr:hypothetical protein [archaeon]